MTVNHASTLKKEYFLSYINLIIISRNCSLEEAKDLAMKMFFHNNIEQYGKSTAQRFLEAYKELETKLKVASS
nr:hypothetical protein [Neobacillus sp. Marseille-Q6967]